MGTAGGRGVCIGRHGVKGILLEEVPRGLRAANVERCCDFRVVNLQSTDPFRRCRSSAAHLPLEFSRPRGAGRWPGSRDATSIERRLFFFEAG